MVKTNLPTRKLREHPDLDQLRGQAKELLAAFTAGDAVAEVNAHYRERMRAKLQGDGWTVGNEAGRSGGTKGFQGLQ